jgi:hypothetical protein
LQCNFASKSAKTKRGKEREKTTPNLQEKTQNSIETKILEH